MTYVVIAYELVGGLLSACRVHLFRERRSLRRRLAEAPQADRA